MSDELAPDCALPKCYAEASIPVWVGLDELGVCEKHANSIWQSVEWRDAKRRHEDIPGRESREGERAEARKVSADRSRKPDAMGQIYYAAVDGLIKVGWSGNLFDRVRRFPPNSVVLAHYPAPRSEETTLHQQLLPSRAKGREWYSDGPIIQDFIAKAIEKHGPPSITTIAWTEPKTSNIKPKRLR